MIAPGEERRDTPLARLLKERVRREGPIPVSSYIQACLYDPDHGYYRKRHAIGMAGDFVTAPEISQIFGELVGLWCAVVWQQMGSPARVALIELGPGRGTMMRDALRTARRVPRFHDAVAVHLIESSAVLREQQQRAFAAETVPFTWHENDEAMTAGIPSGPMIVLANEYLDALPVDQSVFAQGAWHERGVGLDAGGEFCFVTNKDARPTPSALPTAITPAEGDVVERCPGAERLGRHIAERAGRAPLAALIIDYGHVSAAVGDTLQAVHRQHHVSPFHAPGDIDLSHQVDFEAFARACRQGADAVAIDGPVAQAEFLGSLGMIERASRLMAANPGEAIHVETGVARLMGAMGSRFKAVGVRSKHMQRLPGLAIGPE